jgi:NAD(P)-dependent dehydrogenase (short-subunit alcohol dehydrogenase family)
MTSKITQPQIILITGCSSGFGLLTAARLSSLGHQVIATMRDINKSGPLKEEVKRRGGGNVDIIRVDVTNKTTVTAAMKDIAARYGYLDVVVNNAGTGLVGFFEDLTDEEIRQVFEINYFGVLNVTRAAIPLMRPRKKGKIINISSSAGFSTSPCFGAYNASKWALEAFSESLRYELGLFGIDVLLIEPGVYKTKIFYENAHYAKNFRDPHSPYYAISQHLEKIVRGYVDDCFKDPEDIAILVEKLINSKKSSFRNIPDIEAQCLYFLRRLLPFQLFSSIYKWGTYKGLRSSESAKK